MSWLRKIVSTVCSGRVEQLVEGVVDAMPTTQCLTEEPALANGADHEDENPTKQRRYFVKTGMWVDNEEEELAARNGSNGSEEVVFDRPPVDLRTLFPKLSLR